MLKFFKNKDFILQLQIFMMLFLSASCVAGNEIISVEVLMVLWGTLFLWLLRKAIINTKEFVPFVLLVLIVFLSDFVNGERFTLTILMLAMLGTSFLFVARTSLERFVKAYIDVMAFLSATSLVFYTLCLTIPSFQSYNVILAGSRYVANFYIYVHAIDSIRNFGIFWEPGAFQAFLSIALLLEIYRKEPNILRFILFVVTSATTFSTTGYITIGLIAILVLSKHRGSVTKLRRTVIVLLPIAIFLIISNAIFLSGNEGSVFGKITSFVDNKDYEGVAGSTSTASVRYFAIIKPLEEFVASPFFGCGYEHLQERTSLYAANMITCTFVNFFAIYGLFYGVIMFVGYARFCSMLERKKYLSFFVFVLFFVITMSENLVRCPLFIMIPLYGIAQSKIVGEEKFEYVKR